MGKLASISPMLIGHEANLDSNTLQSEVLSFILALHLASFSLTLFVFSSSYSSPFLLRIFAALDPHCHLCWHATLPSLILMQKHHSLLHFHCNRTTSPVLFLRYLWSYFFAETSKFGKPKSWNLSFWWLTHLIKSYF